MVQEVLDFFKWSSPYSLLFTCKKACDLFCLKEQTFNFKKSLKLFTVKTKKIVTSLYTLQYTSLFVSRNFLLDSGKLTGIILIWRKQISLMNGNSQSITKAVKDAKIVGDDWRNLKFWRQRKKKKLSGSEMRHVEINTGWILWIFKCFFSVSLMPL